MAAATRTMDLVDSRPLFARIKPTIFAVVFKPVKGWADEAKHLAEEASTRPNEELDVIFAKSDWASQTGIASREDNRYLYITTCAHVVDYLFHATLHPIEPATINRLFEIEILCHHAEVDFAVRRHGLGERIYSPAVVCGINCAEDLMMLRVDKRELAISGVGRGKVRCTQLHPVLPLSTAATANELGTQCMLISWPEFRSCTFAEGTQCQERVRSDMATNPVGYDMNILEAYIGSTGGSSGGPLLNAAGRIRGILHGGQGGSHSHFIMSRYIMPFIDQYAVPPPPPPAPSKGPTLRDHGRGRGPPKDDKTGPSGGLKRGRSDFQSNKSTTSGGSTRRYYQLRSQG